MSVSTAPKWFASGVQRVGASGMGHYHGAKGFRTLSHAKAVYERGRINSARLIYPPYKNKLLALLSSYLSR